MASDAPTCARPCDNRYPVCENRLESPQCVDTEENLGYLRLFLAIFAAVFIPIAFVLAVKLASLLILSCSRTMREKR
jgi:hypothetical protein